MINAFSTNLFQKLNGAFRKTAALADSVINKSDLMGHFEDIPKKNIENLTFWIRHFPKHIFISFYSKSHTLVYKLNILLRGNLKLLQVSVTLTVRPALLLIVNHEEAFLGVPRFFCFFGCFNRSSVIVGLAATTPKMVSAAKMRLKFLVNNGKVFTNMRRWGSAPTIVHTNLSQMQWNSLSVLTTVLNADDTCLVTHFAVLLTAGGAGILKALSLAVVHRRKLERCTFSEGLIAEARLSTPAERDSNLCN